MVFIGSQSTCSIQTFWSWEHGLFWWVEYGIIMMGCGRGISEGRDWKNAQGSRPLQVASSSLTVCTFSKTFCIRVACILWSVVNIDNESRFHCSKKKKKQYLTEKKIRTEGFTWKKIPAQAVSEKKKFLQAENSPPPNCFEDIVMATNNSGLDSNYLLVCVKRREREEEKGIE